MPINNSYDEAAIVEAIATALDNFYTNLIKKVDLSLIHISEPTRH